MLRPNHTDYFTQATHCYHALLRSTKYRTGKEYRGQIMI
jgi:hypothetical protein